MTNQKRIKNGEAGFSLIEMMIAVVVLAVGLVAILGSTTSLYQQQKQVEYQIVTMSFMENLLSFLQDETADNAFEDDIDLVLFPIDGVDVDLFNGPVDIPSDGLGLQAGNTVSLSMARVGDLNANPAEVEVTMTFLNAQGRRQTFTAKRMITAGDGA